MSPKEKILAFVNRFHESVTRDEVLYKLDLYLNVELGLKDLEEGKVIDHDELFKELLSDEKDQNNVVQPSTAKSSGDKKLHRQRHGNSGTKIHKPIKAVRNKIT